MAPFGVTPAHAAEPKTPKNIIYMIGDGMGYNHVARLTLDKWWNGEKPAGDKKLDDGSSADSPWLIAILSILGVAGLLAVIAQAAPSLVDSLRGQFAKF